MQVHADYAHGVFDAGESRALHRIFTRAKHAVDDRIATDDEIERRLALIVLFTFADGALAPADEDAIAQTCVERLMARTSAV